MVIHSVASVAMVVAKIFQCVIVIPLCAPYVSEASLCSAALYIHAKSIFDRRQFKVMSDSTEQIKQDRKSDAETS